MPIVKRRRVSGPVLGCLLGAFLVVAVLAAIRWPISDFLVRNPVLEDMRPNVWTKIHESARISWHRQAHAGLAFDSNRGTLLVFGSDTHGDHWDNSVHEFNPARLEWDTHYEESSSHTYQVDTEGRPVAGAGGLFPWAMHTYDGVVYDPSSDALVIVAKPEHNPIGEQLSKERVDVTWVYSLQLHQWVTLPLQGRTSHPRFFGAASAYDEARDVIVTYSKGIYELGPKRDAWQKATSQSHHDLHKTMVYDSWRNFLVVFGDYRGISDVWVYSPGAGPGRPGTWEKRVPAGDEVPPGSNIPAAFDRDHGVFLLAVDAPASVAGANAAWTFIYDPESNIYRRLWEADLPRLGMNYMMAYDHYRRIFLLVTGSYYEPLTVWALRLDPTSLSP